MSLKDCVLDFFFPPRCAFCGAILEESGDGVCSACRKALPRAAETERKCDFVRAYTAPFYYEEPVRQGMLAYKFRNAPSRGKVFGRMIGEDLLRRGIDGFDLISWVPLSAKRHRRRGYDQARLLAEAAAEALGTAAVPLLRKVRDVSPQSRLRTPEERRANISGCYVVRSADAVRGKRILLIDDIITTGSTLSECARMLLTAGAVSVRGAALACHREE